MEPHGGDNPTDSDAPDETSLAPPMAMPPIQGVRPVDTFDTAENPSTPATAPDPEHIPHLIPAAAIDPWGVESEDAAPTDPWGLGVAVAEEPEPIDESEAVHVTREEQAQLIPTVVEDEPAPAASEGARDWRDSAKSSPEAIAVAPIVEPERSAIFESDSPDDRSDDIEDDSTPEEFEDTFRALPRKGGGVLTIPLICIGVAVIACTTLLPLADENHRQAWEREKLKQDLAHLREQVRVNDEFLHRVADDPTLAERLAQRQMHYVRQGSSVLPLRGAGNHEMSPFHLVAVPLPKPMPVYQPVGGVLATLVRNPRTQLYMSGGALLFIAAGLVLGYVPRTGD
jgi:hypothetical protein